MDLKVGTADIDVKIVEKKRGYHGDKMVAISFSDQKFVDRILQDVKTRTSRSFSLKRYKQLRQANLYQLYYKQRTSDCKKICNATPGGVFLLKYDNDMNKPPERWLVDEDANEIPQTRRKMGFEEYKEHVKKEGFDDVTEMYSWFNKRLDKNEQMNDKEFIVICFRRVI